MNKTWGKVLLSLVLIIIMLPVQAFAVGKIDIDRDVTLTISYQDEGVPLVGAKFDLYRVADVNAYNEYELTEVFAQYPVTLHGLDAEGWRALAYTLTGYVQRDKITPLDSGKTDSEGKVVFPNQQTELKPGLYLVQGHRHKQNRYNYMEQSFMVLLPGVYPGENQWTYDMALKAKFEKTPISDNDPDDPEKETIDREVKKVWNDKDASQRPNTVTIQLLKDGVVYDEVTLSKDNSWSHSWKDLDSSNNWTVVEKNVGEGYSVLVTKEGSTFVVTNKHEDVFEELEDLIVPPVENPDGAILDSEDDPLIEAEDEHKLPQTGQLWWPVPFLVIGGLLLFCIGWIRNRGEADE